MKKKKTFDMLNGSIWNKLILFALPLAASSILQQLFNAADVAVVGSFAGSGALAAVGANGPIINLLVNSFVGLSIGANVVIASFIGQNDEKRTSLAAHTSILMSVIIGIVLLFVGFFFARPILELMSTPDDIINLAEVYLKIYFIGVPFVMLYNFAAAVLRSKGDTQRPLIALFIGGVINIILNLFFVVVLHMSVEGVAIGTVVSNIFSSMMLLYWLMHETDALRIDLKELKINGRILKKIAKIGVPAGLQGMVFSISNVCIQSSLNALGSDAIAASSAALNYEYFAYYLVNAFAQTVVTFTGQNYGAKDEERCKKIFRLGMLCSVISCGILSTIFVVFRTFFIGLFTSDPSVYHYAQLRFLIVLTFECLTSSYEISGGCLRGFGRSMTPAILTVFGSCVLRLIWLATVCNWFHDYKLLMAIYPISWILTGTMVLVAYFRTRKKLFL